MAGIRSPLEDTDLSQLIRSTPATTDLVSDDDRSIAADSWSIKSEYGSTLDDEQRHAEAAEALSAGNYRAASDYSSDKDEPDAEAVTSMLGLQSYWDSVYADELANFHDHGHSGEVCTGHSFVQNVDKLLDPIQQLFGADVMEVVASWTKSLCIDISLGHLPNHIDDAKSDPVDDGDKYLSTWSVLDIGTGNGLMLQELAKLGFSDLTGTDYSEGAIVLAQKLAQRDGFANINFLVDDVLNTKLERQFQLVTDKGTLDAIGLHPDGPIKRIMYWDAVSRLVARGGILVITSCNNTKDELVGEVEGFNKRSAGGSQEAEENLKDHGPNRDAPPFQYLSHVRSYPTFEFGGSVGSRAATVAFLRN